MKQVLVYIFGPNPEIKMQILGLFLLMVTIPFLTGNTPRPTAPIAKEAQDNLKAAKTK